MHKGHLLGLDEFLARGLDLGVNCMHGGDAAAAGQRLGGLEKHRLAPLALWLLLLPASTAGMLMTGWHSSTPSARYLSWDGMASDQSVHCVPTGRET